MLDSGQASHAFRRARTVRGRRQSHAKPARNVVNDADHMGLPDVTPWGRHA